MESAEFDTSRTSIIKTHHQNAVMGSPNPDLIAGPGFFWERVRIEPLLTLLEAYDHGGLSLRRLFLDSHDFSIPRRLFRFVSHGVPPLNSIVFELLDAPPERV